MDRERLGAWLEEGLSLPEIGEMVDRDPSTVGYWVSKYGLVANGRDKYAPRGGLTLDQLQPLVADGATLQEIAKALGRSTSTVSHWLRKHGLQTRRHHRRKAAQAALRAGLSETQMTCPRHGTTRFFVWEGGRSRCARCSSESVARRRRRVKQQLIEEAGGCCRICGYDRYSGALQFHHLDPASKEFIISRRGITRSIAEARREAAKCVLLCANCHAEVEAGLATVPVQLGRAS